MSTPTSIHKRRIELGLTLRQLADRCAEEGAPIHFTQLGRIEHGKNAPNPKVRAVLARLLDLDVTDFERKAS